MQRTLLSENTRKENLFEAWAKYLEKCKIALERKRMIEEFEGLATISNLSKTRMDLNLEDGRKIRGVPITSKISTHTHWEDTMYVIIGRYELEWRVRDVISIGSLLAKAGSQGEFHLTINPDYACACSGLPEATL